MIGRKKMSGFASLMEIDEAIKTVKRHIGFAPEVELVSLDEAVERFAARGIIAPYDVPSFDRSVVDGYAVKANETTSASPTNPLELEIIGLSKAGSVPGDTALTKTRGTVEIFTGAPLPRNADAVVMAEFCKRTDEKLNVNKPVAPWQNVSRKGEDFRTGEPIVRAGTKLRGWHIGALASANIIQIPVYSRLRVGILSTGTELKEPGEEIRPGEIINSSKPMLKSLVKEQGFTPIDLGCVPDEIGAIKAALTEGLALADLVITTGGTSLGGQDLVPDAVTELGEPGLVVHGLYMRPGKPTGVGIVQGKPVFMLSGFPVAALVAFEVLVEPVIEMILMIRKPPEAKIRGRLTRRVTTPIGVRSYVRVKVARDQAAACIIEPLRLTGSGILSSMTKANGILVVPEGTEGFDEGEQVEVTLIDAVENLT